MANYQSLKSVIQQVVKTNGNNEITGALLQQSLLAIINSLGVGYQYTGIATTSTNPGTPDARVFYFAFANGVYPNFGGLSLNNEMAIFYYDTEWKKSTLDLATNDVLRSAIESIEPIIINGNVVNAPDEIDITTDAQNLLQFKNRTNINGLGYVILRTGNTIAQQMTQTNTIYEIRNIFDLSGGNLNVPDGSILKFNGGKIKNGNITFVNTTIDAPSTEIVFENVEISGSLIGSNRYAHWFEYSTTGHDDWNLINTLFTQPGNVYLDSKTYNVDKLLHASQSIFLCDDLNIYGCNGCAFNANYTGADSYDPLFNITGKSNITIKNIAINCVIGKTVPPVVGGTSYSSSGLYAFMLNNYCSNLRFSNIQFNNAGCGIKSSRYSDYTGMMYFENITIDNCYFLCDMPIQGTGYANVIIRNCKILSRGTNPGNHAIYMLPIKDAEYTKKSSIYFENCYLYSPEPDGQVVQIFTDGDSALTESTKTYFNDCEIVSTSKAIITSSASATIIMNNCVLKSTKEADINPTGNIKAYNCNFYSCTFYRNFEAYKCNFVTSTLIIGHPTQGKLDSPIMLDGCNIKVSGYLIFNNLDGYVPVIRNCNIEVMGDGVISQRQSQIEPVEFVNCKIKVNQRLAYCPKKVTENIISFINCALTSNLAIVAFDTGSQNIKLNIVNCSFNGDTINIPTTPRNSGISSKRPTYGLSVGQVFFDETLGMPIWYTGTKWVKATGEDA